MVFSCVSGKAMRTLVADPNCEQRRFVEKSLTALGYFRTSTASCFEELIALTHYSPSVFERFDLLIVNSSIFSTHDIEWFDFCLGSSRLKHVLIADLNKNSSEFDTLIKCSDRQVWRVQDVNTDVLTTLIPLIDSRSV